MNILLLSQFLSTTIGGGEYVFSLVARNLAKNGHNVWVITNKLSNVEYEKHKNIKIVYVPPTLEYKHGLPPTLWDHIRYTTNAVIAGIKIIKKEKIVIIHSQNFFPSLAGSVLAYLTSKPHIITVHHVFSHCGKNYWKSWGTENKAFKLTALLAPLFEKFIFKLRYDCIFTGSEATRDDLREFNLKKPIHVIYYSIENNSINNEIKTNPLQFVCVGRLVFYKNIEVIIKAVSIIKKREQNIKLIIIGTGPHKKALEELTTSLGLESNIEFRGHVSTEEKVRIIATSSALAFPSLCEGFGLVILEAFEQNKPALVSDIRPLSDIVSHGKNGYVLNPNDENEWAEYFLKIIRNPQDALEMGKNGNVLLNTLYSQETMYQKILKMYSDLV